MLPTPVCLTRLQAYAVYKQRSEKPAEPTQENTVRNNLLREQP